MHTAAAACLSQTPCLAHLVHHGLQCFLRTHCSISTSVKVFQTRWPDAGYGKGFPNNCRPLLELVDEWCVHVIQWVGQGVPAEMAKAKADRKITGKRVILHVLRGMRLCGLLSVCMSTATLQRLHDCATPRGQQVARCLSLSERLTLTRAGVRVWWICHGHGRVCVLPGRPLLLTVYDNGVPIIEAPNERARFQALDVWRSNGESSIARSSHTHTHTHTHICRKLPGSSRRLSATRCTCTMALHAHLHSGSGDWRLLYCSSLERHVISDVTDQCIQARLTAHCRGIPSTHTCTIPGRTRTCCPFAFG